ncbi:MAG: PfkB family carbohydrate kinase [Ignavibacteriales bacterium]|nr:PfkB family carbohydrate kinase [Ignavibacteriales bacterium]
MSLVIVGSVAFDTIRTPWGDRERIVGGSGTYCSLAASFFTRPRIVGVVGRDFPRKTLAELTRPRRRPARASRSRPARPSTGKAGTSDDPNQPDDACGRSSTSSPISGPRSRQSYRGSRIVYLANLNPEHHDFVLDQFRKPAVVAMDTIRLWIDTEAGRPAQGARPGRYLLRQRRGGPSRSPGRRTSSRPAGRSSASGPSLVVLKKGEHGALVFGRDLVFGVLAHPCEHVVDPTGAGDSFAGGFLGYLDRTRRARPSGTSAGPPSTAASWPRSPSRISASTGSSRRSTPASSRPGSASSAD